MIDFNHHQKWLEEFAWSQTPHCLEVCISTDESKRTKQKNSAQCATRAPGIRGLEKEMEITFTTEASYTDDELITLIKTEGVGFESDNYCSATLFLPERGEIYYQGRTEKYESKPEEVTTWVTSMSHFTYHRVGDKKWSYQGAEAGFLAQNLLPPFPGAKIVSAEGTYGNFQGEDALKEYQKIKGGWSTVWWPIYKGLEGRIIPQTNGWGFGDFAAARWQLNEGRWSECYGKPLQNFVPPPEGNPFKLAQEVLERMQEALNKAQTEWRQQKLR